MPAATAAVENDDDGNRRLAVIAGRRVDEIRSRSAVDIHVNRILAWPSVGSDSHGVQGQGGDDERAAERM